MLSQGCAPRAFADPSTYALEMVRQSSLFAGITLCERGEALIVIADPDFRDELRQHE